MLTYCNFKNMIILFLFQWLLTRMRRTLTQLPPLLPAGTPLPHPRQGPPWRTGTEVRLLRASHPTP